MAMSKAEQVLWEKISLSTRLTITKFAVGMPTARLREILKDFGFEMLVCMENGAPMVETEATMQPDAERLRVRSSPDGQILAIIGWG